MQKEPINVNNIQYKSYFELPQEIKDYLTPAQLKLHKHSKIFQSGKPNDSIILNDMMLSLKDSSCFPDPQAHDRMEKYILEKSSREIANTDLRSLIDESINANLHNPQTYENTHRAIKACSYMLGFIPYIIIYASGINFLTSLVVSFLVGFTANKLADLSHPPNPRPWDEIKYLINVSIINFIFSIIAYAMIGSYIAGVSGNISM